MALNRCQGLFRPYMQVLWLPARQLHFSCSWRINYLSKVIRSKHTPWSHTPEFCTCFSQWFKTKRHWTNHWASLTEALLRSERMEIPFAVTAPGLLWEILSWYLKNALTIHRNAKWSSYTENESKQKCQKGGYSAWQSLKLLVHEVSTPLWCPHSRFAVHKRAFGVVPTHLTKVLLTWKAINSFK